MQVRRPAFLPAHTQPDERRPDSPTAAIGRIWLPVLRQEPGEVFRSMIPYLQPQGLQANLWPAEPVIASDTMLECHWHHERARKAGRQLFPQNEQATRPGAPFRPQNSANRADGGKDRQ